MAAYLLPMLDEDSWSRIWVFPILDKDSKKKTKEALQRVSSVLLGDSVRLSAVRVLFCAPGLFTGGWFVLLFGAFLLFGDLVLCVVCVVRGAVCFVWCGHCGAFSRS
jgi:hypothetical protein